MWWCRYYVLAYRKYVDMTWRAEKRGLWTLFGTYKGFYIYMFFKKVGFHDAYDQEAFYAFGSLSKIIGHVRAAAPDAGIIGMIQIRMSRISHGIIKRKFL